MFIGYVIHRRHKLHGIRFIHQPTVLESATGYAFLYRKKKFSNTQSGGVYGPIQHMCGDEQTLPDRSVAPLR